MIRIQNDSEFIQVTVTWGCVLYPSLGRIIETLVPGLPGDMLRQRQEGLAASTACRASSLSSSHFFDSMKFSGGIRAKDHRIVSGHSPQTLIARLIVAFVAHVRQNAHTADTASYLSIRMVRPYADLSCWIWLEYAT